MTDLIDFLHVPEARAATSQAAHASSTCPAVVAAAALLAALDGSQRAAASFAFDDDRSGCADRTSRPTVSSAPASAWVT